MTQAERYLDGIREADRYVEKLFDSLKEAQYDLSAYKSPVLDGVASYGSGIADKTADLVIRLESFYERWCRSASELIEKKTEAFDLISQIPKLDYRLILLSRFFDGSSMEEIAEELDKSLTWTYELYRRALKEFDKVLQTRRKNHTGG